MSKELAPSYLVLRATTGINLATSDLKIAGSTSSYVRSSAHDFLDDVTNIVATSANLGSKTTTAGVLDAADVSMGSPAGPSVITQFTLYKDTGSAATSNIIYWWNEDASAAAIAITCNGEEITIAFNASGIFR